MITTGSKFSYALGALLLVAAVVYGYTTGGGEVGPLSAGYKGAVGDVFGYTVLLFGAAASTFVGFALTAFRDADPEAGAALTGTDRPVDGRVAGPSYWPLVGAFGVAVTVIGLVLSNVFFVAGLIVLGAVAIEWTMQTWADHATGDPAVNREIRNRIMLPLEAPIAGALAIGVVVVGISRVLLTASAFTAVWVALGAAALVFGVGTLLSTRKDLRTDVVAGLLALTAVAVIGLGIFGAVNGERDFEHHESDHGEQVDDGHSSTDSAEPVEESH